jgi:hypothetical protein
MMQGGLANAASALTAGIIGDRAILISTPH